MWYIDIYVWIQWHAIFPTLTHFFLHFKPAKLRKGIIHAVMIQKICHIGSCCSIINVMSRSVMIGWWLGVSVGSKASVTMLLILHGMYVHVCDKRFTGAIMDLNSSPPGQNGRHFADDIFRCLFREWKVCTLIKWQCNDWHRTWIKLWTHSRHPLPHPVGCPAERGMGYLLWGLWRKFTVLYNITAPFQCCFYCVYYGIWQASLQVQVCQDLAAARCPC